MSDNLKILIPAAGLGSRMGFPQSKEMLLDAEGFPLIHHSLRWAEQLKADIHVITRAEKRNLISYLENLSIKANLQVQVVQAGKEWPETLLFSQSFWNQKNLVILPDTRWQPEAAILQVADLLRLQDLVYGVFQSQQDTAFGFVKSDHEQTQIIEKPISLEVGYQAWGLMGFDKKTGHEVLMAHLESTFDHQIKKLDLKCGLVTMQSFVDLTRN